MSSSLNIVFISFILVLVSTSHAASSSPLIKEVCDKVRKNYARKMCDETLESEPRVASATNMYNLTVEIMKSGISRSNRTRCHIEILLKENSTNPKTEEALKQCKESYDWSIGSTRSALGETEEGEYQMASYDLLLSATDCLRDCKKVVASKVINDKIIVRGNELAVIFGLSAFLAIDLIPTN